MDRLSEAADRLKPYPDADKNQRDGIEKCGEHACAMIAEGLPVGCGTRLKVNGNKGEQQRQGVGAGHAEELFAPHGYSDTVELVLAKAPDWRY